MRLSTGKVEEAAARRGRERRGRLALWNAMWTFWWKRCRLSRILALIDQAAVIGLPAPFRALTTQNGMRFRQA